MSFVSPNDRERERRENGISPKIAALLSLLDDENEDVAVNAMAELLYCEEELGEALAGLQESPDALTRKRAHQLQAAITLRRRRRYFSELLKAPHVDMIEGLIEVHLQWFDNDSRPGLQTLWRDFADEAAAASVLTGYGDNGFCHIHSPAFPSGERRAPSLCLYCSPFSRHCQTKMPKKRRGGHWEISLFTKKHRPGRRDGV